MTKLITNKRLDEETKKSLFCVRSITAHYVHREDEREWSMKDLFEPGQDGLYIIVRREYVTRSEWYHLYFNYEECHSDWLEIVRGSAF